jgi:hypothetical protein
MLVAAALTGTLPASGGSTSASADSTADPRVASTPLVSEKSELYWYGWQIGVLGGTAGLVVTGGAVLRDVRGVRGLASALLVAGMPVFIFAGPVVHWSNQNLGKGMLSFALNLAVPAASGLAGSGIACSVSKSDRSCGINGFWAGVAAATLVEPWIDGLALGWREVTLERTVTATPSRSWQILPTLLLGRTGHAGVAIAASF